MKTFITVLRSNTKKNIDTGFDSDKGLRPRKL